MGERMPELQLYPYQEEGARVLAAHTRFGLHDEMGIGKTATTIGAIDLLRDARPSVRGVVVCPAMLRENWLNEFKKFARHKYRIVKGLSNHDFIAWQRGHFDILITSYEMATKWRDLYAESYDVLDFVALDEAHFVKNPNANRTQAVFGFLCKGNRCWTSYATNVWHITGTPMSDQPFDIYPFLRMVRAIEMSPVQFAQAYFKVIETPFGVKYEPNPMFAQPLAAMISNNRVARTMSDVGIQLPPVRMSELMVDGDLREIMELVRAHPDAEAAILEAIDAGGLSQLDAPYIATLRRLVGVAKAIPFGRILAAELKAAKGTKRVVFTCHTTPALTLEAELAKNGIECVVVNGASNEAERIDAVRRFQDPNSTLRVFIGQMKVAAQGLTLTASHEVDILESAWGPADNAQAIKRVHRIGQLSKTVRARFITLAASLDERINKKVAAKTAAIAMLDGRELVSTPGGY